MDSKRVNAFRPAARVGVLASSIALLAAMISTSGALAVTTTIGATNSGDSVCTLSIDSIQLSSSDPLVSYTVPANGTSIDSWSTQSLGFTGLVGLQVWRLVSPATPTALAVYMLVGASSLVVPTAAPNMLTPAIAVMPGDMIGMRMEGLVACGTKIGMTASDVWTTAFGPTPPTLGTESFLAPTNSFRLNISATVTTTVTPPPPPPSTGCDYTGTSSGNDTCTT